MCSKLKGVPLKAFLILGPPVLHVLEERVNECTLYVFERADIVGLLYSGYGGTSHKGSYGSLMMSFFTGKSDYNQRAGFMCFLL